MQVQKAIAGLDLPNNPLDELIDRLGGPSTVAEMTGRKGRLVRRRDGEAGVKWEARNASGVDKGSSLEMINILERKMFLSGEKLVAVISEAASAGISLHADRCFGRLRGLFVCSRVQLSGDAVCIVKLVGCRSSAGMCYMCGCALDMQH